MRRCAFLNGAKSSGAATGGWWLGLTLAVASALAACRPESPPTIGANHAVVARTRVAAASECPQGGSAVESGLDANDDGQLEDTEVTQRTPVCQATPPDQPPPVVLSRADLEPSGSHCPSGGNVVRSGPDANGDGVLQDAEVQATAYACAGRSVTRIVAEAAGTLCERGGSAVQSGADDNGNGKLDDPEVDAVDYVCDAVLLTRLVSELPGAHCAGGGVAFLIGRDLDRDHTLAASEVEWTEYECSDVVSRNVEVQSPDELKALVKVRVITGRLALSATGVTELSLPLLEQVGGLEVGSSRFLERLSLPALTAIHGDLSLKSDSKLVALNLERLARVDGSLWLTTNPLLVDLSGLSSLASVGGDLVVSDNATLASVDVPLRSVGESVEFSSNPSLRKVEATIAPGVKSLFVLDNAALTDLRVSIAPTSFDGVDLGPVVVARNPSLTNLQLSARSVESVAVYSSPELTHLSLSVSMVRGDTLVVDDPKLRVAAFRRFWPPDSHEFGGQLFLSAPIEQLSLDSDVFVNARFLRLEGTRLSALTGFGRVQSLVLRGNPNLVQVWVPMLEADLELHDNAALSDFRIDFLLPTLRFVTIKGNAALLDLSTLASVASFQDLSIIDNRSLARTGITGATSIIGDLEVTGNSALQSIDLPAVRTIGGYVTISRNGMSTWSGLARLEAIQGAMIVYDEPTLLTVDLPALREVGDSFFLETNAALQSINLPALQGAGSISITDNPHLPACLATALLDRTKGNKSQSGNDETAVCP